ncbi:GNAT family N-acetyltransferase [Phytohabitans flavus]|nr:GNAT family protein [Phytohabitans flavus]
MTTLRGERVTLRLAASADIDAIVEIRSSPEVRRWWGDEEDYRAAVLEEISQTYAIVLDGEVVGAIQWYENDDPQYRHAGLDIYLHPDRTGQGLGTDAVRTLARHLIRDRSHHRLVIDPAADNEPAIRAYRKVGFKPVGLMRAYERGQDGTFHDGLLMDLLAGELT